MNRRDGLRLLASAALSPLAGCALPVVRSRESEPYRIPTRALAMLRRRAVRGYSCWQEGQLVSSSGNAGPFPVLSITKSVSALLVMRAIGRGWITADETVDFPEWRNAAGEGSSLRHLLNSSAGLPPGERELYSARPFDKGRAAVALRHVQAPGAAFRYGPAPWELLGEWLKRRLMDHGVIYQEFLAGLLDDLGIRPGDWRRDGTGMPYLSTGMVCGLEDLGRLGRAIAALASGRNAAGVKAEIFRDLSAPRAANPMFSAGIWWNRLARLRTSRAVEPENSLSGAMPAGFWRNACLQPAARAEWLALVGSGGIRVYVLPSADAVIAVSGGVNWSDAAVLRALSDR